MQNIQQHSMCNQSSTHAIARSLVLIVWPIQKGTKLNLKNNNNSNKSRLSFFDCYIETMFEVYLVLNLLVQANSQMHV
jgi:hypothetical protein